MFADLLEERNHPCFRALLTPLSSQDLARLRQVNQAVCKCTTRYIPYLVLRLCDAKNELQLQQWQQATRKMRQAPKIMMLIEGTVTARMFEAAMKMLATHTSAETLHLQGVNDATWFKSNHRRRQDDCRPCLDQLLPVQHMLHRLKCLIIEGIIFTQLPRDLKELAAKNRGWQQLEVLKVDAVWKYASWSSISWDSRVHWSICAAALMQLAQAFPMLTEVYIKLPDLNFDPHPSILDSAVYERPADAKPPFIGLGYALANSTTVAQLGSIPESIAALDTHVPRQLTAVAVVIAVANAALQWQHVQNLTVSEVPNIWCPLSLLSGSMAPSAAATAATTTQAAHAVFTDRIFASAQLQSTPATAELFITMEDCGSWLLQQHEPLIYLMFSTPKSNCHGTCMTWRQQEGRCDSGGGGSSSSSMASDGADGAASSLCDIRLMHSAKRARNPTAESASSSMQGSTISSKQPPLMGLLARLSPYSSQPAAASLGYITDITLEVSPHGIGELSGLLCELKSLKHLQVKLVCEDNLFYQHTLGTTVAAAATVQGLRSLEVRSWWGRHALPADILLPLTAAAGGPGRSLTKLLLGANFVTDGEIHAAAAAEKAGSDCDVTGYSTSLHMHHQWSLTGALEGLNTDATMAAAATATHQVKGSTAWHNLLQQLTGLRELSIMQSGTSLLEFPWESLPASLEVLECGSLHIVAVGKAAESDCQELYTSSSKSSAVHPPRACAADGTAASTSFPPQLRQLTLQGCSVSSARLLASRLQQLTVINSKCSTFWASAAAVCPTVGTVTWQYHADHGDQDIGLDFLVAATTKQMAAYTGGESMLQDRAAGTSQPGQSAHPAVLQLQNLSAKFEYLRTLTLTGFPCKLTAEDLQPVVHYLKNIGCLRICISSRDCTAGACIPVQMQLQQQLPWATVLIDSSN